MKKHKKRLRSLTETLSAAMLALSLAACAPVAPAAPSSLPVQSGAPASSAPQSNPVQTSVPAVDGMPEQAKEYVRRALDGSVLLTINPRGEVVKTVDFPGFAYSAGRLTPDGRYMLCQKNAESAGEASWCAYTVIDLETGNKYDWPHTQQGYQSHRILDDNLIGFAYGSKTTGPEEPWEPIRLFDIRYRPLDVTLAFDFGGEIVIDAGEDAYSYLQNSVTGICYDRAKQTFVLTYAKDLSQEGLKEEEHADPFSKNRLGVAVFDKNGKLIKNQLLPEEYMAPFSHNVLVLWPADPAVLHDGRLLVEATDPEGQSALLLIDPNNWSVQKLSYSGHGRMAPGGRSVLAFRTEKAPPHAVHALLTFENGKIASEQELPREIPVSGYASPFFPSDAVWYDARVYVKANYFSSTYQSFSGLFFSDGENMNLVHLLPLEYCNLVGSDRDGNCLLLIAGATQQSRRLYQHILEE